MPLGKRVVIPVRFSEPMAAAIDEARGETPRSVWIEEAVAARLGGPAEVPAASDPVEAVQPSPAKKNCKHGRMRMTKGVCPDCGEWVSK